MPSRIFQTNSLEAQVQHLMAPNKMSGEFARISFSLCITVLAQNENNIVLFGAIKITDKQLIEEGERDARE